MNLLLLGGTAEARELATGLAARRDIVTTLSLAGATRRPRAMPVPVRRGGFGGIAGLARYLVAQDIDHVIDATHPFAATMSANADAACRASGGMLWRLERPAWRPGPGDDWRAVADSAAAARHLADFGRRVFLSVGSRSLAPFAAVPGKHWIVRVIDPPDPSPAFDDWTLIQARPPFTLADEIALLAREQVEVLVTKNSGAPATAAKLAAARELGVPVVMIERPALPVGPRVFADPATLLSALDTVRESHHASGYQRGV